MAEKPQMKTPSKHSIKATIKVFIETHISKQAFD